ncbi:UNVERIFIED_CONTAM: hypothetical protein K2H54_051962 [Gekko kuhli]
MAEDMVPGMMAPVHSDDVIEPSREQAASGQSEILLDKCPTTLVAAHMVGHRHWAQGLPRYSVYLKLCLLKPSLLHKLALKATLNHCGCIDLQVTSLLHPYFSQAAGQIEYFRPARRVSIREDNE